MAIWTETSLKIIRILISTDSRTRSDLAGELGFKNPLNLANHIDGLVRQGFLVQEKNGRLSDPRYTISHDIAVISRLYYNRHYTRIRGEIRSVPWLILDMTAGYQDIDPPLLEIIRLMARHSHSFWEYILTNPTPDELIHTFRYCMFPFRFIPDISKEQQFSLLVYQLYAQAIPGDMKNSGLIDGFCEPLKSIRIYIKGQMGENGYMPVSSLMESDRHLSGESLGNM